MAILGHSDCHTVSMDSADLREEIAMIFFDYSRPKNGSIYKVIEVERISTLNQNEKSLDDQQAYCRGQLGAKMPGCEFDFTRIAGQGSGQYLDREEFLKLCELVESGEYDIVIAEDLGRILRRMQAITFCEEAEDSGTRVIAFNDFVDTKEDNWRQAAFFAAYKNQSFCIETSKRIRRTFPPRFLAGGIFMCNQYGYIKTGSTDDDVIKDPETLEVYETWISMLENGAAYSEVARWLIANNVPTGPYCTTEKWTGAMVKRLTYNPILKGERHRNKRISVRINKTGRPKSVLAPPDTLLVRQAPHLAFVEPERWDRLIRQLDKRNKKYQRSAEQKNDPRAGIPKKQTRWPGQHIRCGVCGRLFVFGGHGRTERMMCNGAREYQCWNAMTISGPDVASSVGDVLRELVQAMPDFDRQWVDEYEAQRSELMASHGSELDSLRKRRDKEARVLGNYIEALGELKSSPALIGKIGSTESLINDLNDEIFQLEKEQQANPTLPSLADIQREASAAFHDMTNESPEFGRLMRNVVDELFVLPYRLADGGEVQPRIRFRASLGVLVGQPHMPNLEFERTVDLAKRPRRLRFLAQVVRMVGEGMKHADVADELGIFKTEVYYAMRLHRRMLELETEDPWAPVTAAEQVYGCYKRVRNPIFKFEPLLGFETTRHPAA